MPHVLTQHNDIGRSGLNSAESILRTSNVNVTTFGKLFTRRVDGEIYAQPLYVQGAAIPGHSPPPNVVYVATMHNSVYAFDADHPAASTAFWHTSLQSSSSLPDSNI